jgi:hypothetical protein
MTRVKRRLLRWLLVTDFALLLLLCAWWARSGYFDDTLACESLTRRVEFRSDWGRLVFIRIDAPHYGRGFSWTVSQGGYHTPFLGPGNAVFTIESTIEVFTGQFAPTGIIAGYPGPYTRVTIYYWVPACLLAMPLILTFLVRRRHKVMLRHRKSKGLCLACGYDLRGNSSERCPECGVEIDPSRRVCFSTP